MSESLSAGAAMLEKAKATIEARHATYGAPDENFHTIAALWDAYLRGRKIGVHGTMTKADVAILNVLVKVARLAETPDHADSWLDIAGYAACGAEVTAASVLLKEDSNVDQQSPIQS